MADFRKLAKDNPLKPRPVAIPQLDPLKEIDTQNQKPTQQETRKTIKKPATTAQKDVPPATTPPAETGDLDSYKSKYLRKEDEKVTRTFRMYKWRDEQLEQEVRATGLSQWQIIDVGLEMYFRDKLKEK
ncbi:MAG TPA: hypothetical protein VNG51_10100 [Ktedonobacteraceae bacterium]|nr:hypothetical protein [Ktedonobacteraceae bacterium]